MTMRNPIIAAMMLPALLLAAPNAGGDEPQADESTQALAEAKEMSEPEFTPPPGFRARKRGQHVVYCRREEPKGTRFPAEVCYDEQGIRSMLQTLKEDQMKVDQIRKTQAITNTCCR
ncbi:MAG: hypothetical protein ACREIV_00055 [Planctomycetaceae bacterium]